MYHLEVADGYVACATILEVGSVKRVVRKLAVELLSVNDEFWVVSPRCPVVPAWQWRPPINFEALSPDVIDGRNPRPHADKNESRFLLLLFLLLARAGVHTLCFAAVAVADALSLRLLPSGLVKYVLMASLPFFLLITVVGGRDVVFARSTSFVICATTDLSHQFICHRVDLDLLRTSLMVPLGMRGSTRLLQAI